MGFSSPDSPANLGSKKPDTDFLGSVGNYFEQRFPVANGLADMVFGASAPSPGSASMPTGNSMMQSPQQAQPDIVAMNAKPENGSQGFSTIMRLLSGGF